jgi:hypothetical protein
MTALELSEDVKQDRVGDELVLYHPNGNLYVLNKTGGFILTESLSHGDQDAIVSALMNEYDVPLPVAQKDIEAYLDTLICKGIICEKDS